MKNNEFVTKWAIDTIKEKYADDIALILSNTAFNINEEEAFNFFVPATERGKLRVSSRVRVAIINNEMKKFVHYTRTDII